MQDEITWYVRREKENVKSERVNVYELKIEKEIPVVCDEMSWAADFGMNCKRELNDVQG